VSSLLEQALMAMPAPDFSLSLFLIPERVVSFFLLLYFSSFYTCVKSRMHLGITQGHTNTCEHALSRDSICYVASYKGHPIV
jgi:hypothetical protein